jgi:hypothetical protein
MEPYVRNIWKLYETTKPFNSKTKTYCEITFIRGVPIFVVFMGKLIREN